MHQIPGHAHRTGLVIQHNHGAGAHTTADFRHGGEVHGRIQMFFCDKVGRRTARKQRSKCHASRIPPACSSRISRIVVPMGSSQRPGRFTFPLTPNSLVPASSVRPKARNHSPPRLMM